MVKYHFEVDGNYYIADNNSYLIVNNGQNVIDNIEIKKNSEIFSVFIQPQFANNALRGLITNEDKLLDIPYE